MNCARPHCNPTPSDTLCPKDHTSHFIHTPLFTLHAPHFTLHISHLALHTPHFISSHLISSHFISLSSSHLISHLISARLISSLLGCHLSSSRIFSSHPSIAQNFISSKLFSSSVRQQAFTVREKLFYTQSRCAQNAVDGSGTAKLHSR